MSRLLIILANTGAKLRAAEYINKVPFGTRVEFREPKRTLEQNSRLWAMLSDVAEQKTLQGKRYKTGQWKAIFMQAIGREMEILPTLDGTTWFPLGYSSSKLSKSEMSDLLSYIEAWGAENEVKFNDREAA